MVINGQEIKKGENKIVSITAGELPSGNLININAHVFRSKKAGPTLLVQGGLHGDEINGVEIVRSAISAKRFDKLESGTIIAIPLLNVYGFINFSRSMPDGKDVNRSFPGHSKGSLAARIAKKLTKHILPHVDYAIDYHTGGAERYNWPQIRFTKDDQKSRTLADIFNANCTIQKPLIEKSFRKTARDLGIPTIVFEGGESLRFDAQAIQVGLDGMRRIMAHLGLTNKTIETKKKPIFIQSTSWIRASNSGVFIWTKKSGDKVNAGEVLGNIHDPYGVSSVPVISIRKGIVLGHNNASVVHLGDALFNIGVI